MKILISLLVLGVIILIHELGHFLSARLFKIPVEEFSVGMGTEVYTYDGMKTKYSFRAIPIGGYVNIKGMDLEDKSEDGFNLRPAYQRFIVLIAGVFMNFLLAYTILFGMIYTSGEIKIDERPVVGKVISEKNTTLQEGDLILEIEGKKINTWWDIKETINSLDNSKDLEKNILIERDGEKKEIVTKLTKNNENNKYYLGISPEYHIEKYGIGESLNLALKGFGNILDSLKMMINGEVKREEISGPIGIINIVGEASKLGIGTLLWLVAVLSINIGIFNLLPFPALDGGRLIFVILEILKIKVNKKVEERIHYGGIIIIFMLIIFITANDFMNLIR
ncbi:M50 family metallopeptidase [Fusobacterium perfoetens]|uniref:M50 family metallopeptidase n=1 Tax=Fusobacterium perfoetens TaxID=852 RepID=UPI000485EF5F|nr:M50 family metallopeptidase [Fusobacterium perfoetens]